MKNVLILGINGFIGHHLSKRIYDAYKGQVAEARKLTD